MFAFAIAVFAASAAAPASFAASDLPGRVVFSGVAVPGASVTVTHGDRTIATLSDDEGAFLFANLDEGAWTLRVQMRGFVAMNRDVSVPLTGPLVVALTMQSYDEIVGRGRAGTAPSTLSTPLTIVEEPLPDATDAGVITGSVINGAATPFAQPRAFGNNRPRPESLYTGGINAVAGTSAWNAEPFSFGRANAPAPSYGDLQLGFTLGGPLRIPWLVKYGPQTFIGYQHGVNHSVSTQSASMPTARERSGDFSESSIDVRDPLTGSPFPGNAIPPDRISPQAASLVAFYPRPNVAATRGSNYQTPIVTATKHDSVQVGLNKTVSNRTTLAGAFSFQRTVADSVNLFDFEDTSRQSSLNTAINWSRRFTARLTVRARYRFTRAAASVTPFFANRTNVSGDAGIAGNDQDPVNWGPPALVFPDIAGLNDAGDQRTIRKTNAAGAEVLFRRGTHNITMGGDVLGNRVDVLSQPDPRGTLTFTGAATGHAFADFMLGIPAASSIAFGSAATRLRAAAYDAYLADDWRVHPNVTLNLGVRWEYEAPFTEASGRLVNLDVAPNFAAIRPVLATDPIGSLTNASYPTSLIRPDRRGVQPRLAASWRPVLESTVLVRAGYGIYRNLGAYESVALLLAHQPPFSNTFSIQNGPSHPLTLARPFPSSLPGTSNTFAADPGFRSAYAHNWQVSVQRELAASLTVIAAYLGAKGSHLMQAFLPNTYPVGAENPCATCPSGFLYVTSNGRSLRNAAQFTLRRRLHSGLTATAQYTIAKATDDAATFNNKGITARSLAVAQDWLDLAAERGPSSFDQRHLVSVQFQYTSGVGVTGGTLVDGVRGALFKDWTITSQLTSGSGLPFTPVSFVAVPGTGVVGVRPRLTGAPIEADAGSYANPAAYAAASPGTWGNTGRNSIRGPAQFSLDASLARVLRLRGRLNLEWRVAATNVLNRVTFATIDTVIASPQFGRPTRANPMRTLRTAIQLRF